MSKKIILYLTIFLLILKLVLSFSVSKGTFIIQNHAPILDLIENITVDEGDLVNMSPTATDPNGDNLTFSYTAPLNSSGLWQTVAGDGGSYTSTVTVSDGALNDSQNVTIEVLPYCGDGTCDYSEGESCSNCPADCGICPPTPSGGGGGRGYTRGYVEQLQEEIQKLTNLTKRKDLDNFKAEIQELYIELQEEEFIGKQIAINNYLNETLILRADIIGDLNTSIILDTKYIIILPNSNKSLDLLILANKPVGTYTGTLTLVSSNNYQAIPITLKIIKRLAKPELETLDVDIDIVTPKVTPGKTLKFKLSLRKAPLITEEPEDVLLRYLIMSLKTDYISYITGAAAVDLKNLSIQKEDVIYQEETISIKNIISLPKEIEIPKNFPTGNYVLNINAKFKGKQIPLFARFSVYTPWYSQKIFNVEKGLIAIFASMLLIVWMIFIFSRVRIYGRRRYEIKLDKTSLPKKGPHSAYIGKIAEKNKEAYTNLNDLKTHMLISGTTGCGKTIAAQVIVEEALKKGISVIVFDPTAQWTSFFRKCTSKAMLKRYPEFDMKEEDAKQFRGKIRQIQHPRKVLDFNKLMKDKFNILLLNKLGSKELNMFIANTIKNLFKSHPKERRQLKVLLIFDEVHRLLPRFAGSKIGYTQLERAVREYRKWGIGIVLISQVTEDLVGPIEANIATQIQMKTNDKTDLARIKEKYGEELLRAVFRSPVGTGLLSNSSYNNGKPYFVAFRPILHSAKGLDKKALEEHIKYSSIISNIRDKLAKLQSRKVNIFDLKIELDLAEKQVETGNFDIAKIYLDSLVPKIKKKLKRKRSKQR